MDRITTTIKREFLADIVRGDKKIEYRELKPYWTEKLEGVQVPFELHLINGMTKTAPRALVVVKRVKKDTRRNQYELHLGKILRVQYWDKRREIPRA